MLKKIFWSACLFLAINVIWGCGIVPFVPVVGTTVYDGYVGWRGRVAVKYYAEDVATMRRAVIQASRQLHLEIVSKTADEDGFSHELKCKEPLQIAILPFEKICNLQIDLQVYQNRFSLIHEKTTTSFASTGNGIFKKRFATSSANAGIEVTL